MVPPVLPPQLGAGPGSLFLLVLPAIVPLSAAAWQAVFAPWLVVVTREADRRQASLVGSCAPQAPAGSKGTVELPSAGCPALQGAHQGWRAAGRARKVIRVRLWPILAGVRKAVKPAFSSLWINARSV